MARYSFLSFTACMISVGFHMFTTFIVRVSRMLQQKEKKGESHSRNFMAFLVALHPSLLRWISSGQQPLIQRSVATNVNEESCLSRKKYI